MKPLRIVFMGSPDFAVPSLQEIIKSDHELLAVVTGPDKRRRRRGEPEPTPVKSVALKNNLPVIETDDLKSADFEEQLSGLDADLYVVVAFKILPDNILELPKTGSVNLHASLLPKYRGAAPIHWAIINGETETGCTVFFLDRGVDTGNIVGTVSTPIKPEETTGDLYNRLMDLGAALLVRSLNDIAAGDYELTEQDHTKATPAPKLFNENTRIDFSKPAESVHNLVRGLNPFPVAWCMYDDERMNIYKTAVSTHKGLKPGELRLLDGKLLAGCGEGSVELLELQLPGTKRLSGSEFVNGYDLSVKLS